MISDLFGSASTLSSPFDYYAALRDEAPVFFSKTLNAYVVTRFEDVKYILNTPEIFSSLPAATAQTSAGSIAKSDAPATPSDSAKPSPSAPLNSSPTTPKKSKPAQSHKHPAVKRAALKTTRHTPASHPVVTPAATVNQQGGQ